MRRVGGCSLMGCRLSVVTCFKVLPPCYHISIDRPVLECSVVKVKSKGRYECIHIHSQIFLRKDFHVLRIAHCTGKVFPEERLSFLPGVLYVSKRLLQFTPFMFKILRLLCRLNSTGQEYLKLLWPERRFKIRSSNTIARN